MTRRSWSVTGHWDYSLCPRMWWLLRVARVPQEASEDSRRGTVLHAGMAAGYLAADVAMREGWAGSSVVHEVLIAVDVAVRKAARLHDYAAVDEAIDTCTNALAHLHPHPGDRVLVVERALDTEVSGVPITYRPDVIYQRRGLLTVRDWKSRSELPRARDLRDSRQLALGALCAARAFPSEFLATRRVRVEIASIGSATVVGSDMDRATALKAGDVVAATAARAEADTVFEPKPGAVCATCKVRAYCPVYANEETPEVGPDAKGDPVFRVRTPQMINLHIRETPSLDVTEVTP